MKIKQFIGFIGDTDPKYGGGYIYQIDNEIPWLEYYCNLEESKIAMYKVILDKNYNFDLKDYKKMEYICNIDYEELIMLSESKDAVDRSIFAEVVSLCYGWEFSYDYSKIFTIDEYYKKIDF
jgi:hypothetical protein